MQQSRRQESRRSPYRKRPGCQVALSIQNYALIRRSRLRKSSGLQRSSVATRFCCYPISLKIRSWRRDMDWTELLQDAAIIMLSIASVVTSSSCRRFSEYARHGGHSSCREYPVSPASSISYQNEHLRQQEDRPLDGQVDGLLCDGESGELSRISEGHREALGYLGDRRSPVQPIDSAPPCSRQAMT